MSATKESSHVEIRLNKAPPSYEPGETLEAEVTVPNPADSNLRMIELSVVWHTAGKGDEDLRVHYFTRTPVTEQRHSDAPLGLRTTLPASPLSYAGVIVKVCWCVRVRLYFAGGRQTLTEAPLELGSVATPVLNH